MVNFCPCPTGSLHWLTHSFKRTLLAVVLNLFHRPSSGTTIHCKQKAESGVFGTLARELLGTWLHMMSPGWSKTTAHNYSCPDVCVVSFSDDSSVLGLLPNLSCLTTCCSCLLHDVSAPVRSAREQCGPARQLAKKNLQDTKRGTTRTYPSHPMHRTRSKTVSYSAPQHVDLAEYRCGDVGERSDVAGCYSDERFGTYARDTFRINATACSFNIQNDCKCSSTFRQRFNPSSCPVSLACLVTDTRASSHRYASVTRAVHGETKKTSNVDEVEHA